MDVITVANSAAAVGQAAKAARNVDEALDALLLHAKSGDDTTASLQSDMRGFGDACEALQSLLNSLVGSRTYLREAQDEIFYEKLHNAMGEYALTFDQLGQYVRSVDNSRTGFFRQGRRQTKRNIKNEDIVRARQRISAHLLSVQMVLGILNLYVVLLESRAT